MSNHLAVWLQAVAPSPSNQSEVNLLSRDDLQPIDSLRIASFVSLCRELVNTKHWRGRWEGSYILNIKVTNNKHSAILRPDDNIGNTQVTNMRYL